jgi:hypothetical protein
LFRDFVAILSRIISETLSKSTNKISQEHEKTRPGMDLKINQNFRHQNLRNRAPANSAVQILQKRLDGQKALKTIIFPLRHRPKCIPKDDKFGHGKCNAKVSPLGAKMEPNGAPIRAPSVQKPHREMSNSIKMK